MEIKAKKSLGQNFLINPQIVDKIISAAEINSNDVVLEIGPGTGNLTSELVKKAGTVIAIEKDRRLIDELKNKFSNVNLIEGDVLKTNISDLITKKYKIIGNIPYYITSHLIRIIFEEWPKPELIVLTIQKEVAQRIMSGPPDMNLLALSVQLYSDPKIISYISKNNFKPQPKVDSAIIRLVPNPKTDQETIRKVMALAKKAFAGKRKQLKNTIGIDSTSRPEELSITDWIKLV